MLEEQENHHHQPCSEKEEEKTPSIPIQIDDDKHGKTTRRGRIDFAKYFSMEEIHHGVMMDNGGGELKRTRKQQEFLDLVFHREGLFATTHRVGVNSKSGLTYDGHQISLDNSSLHEPLHDFSSPAKESIHLNMIALALDGHELACKFFLLPLFGKYDPFFGNSCHKDELNENGKRKLRFHDTSTGDKLLDYLLDMLEKKFKSYKDFDVKFPAFGSMLPWFRVNDEGADRMPDWLLRIPSLDNGQFIWSLVALEHVLLKVFNNGEDLINLDSNHKNTYKDRALHIALEVHEKIEIIKKSSITMFYHGEGKVRAITYIKDISIPLNRKNYKGNGKSFIDDTYEGELMVLFMILFGDWTGYDKGEQCRKIWNFKSKRIKKVLYKSKNFGEIAVEECYWASSHEKWKYLLLPYCDCDLNWKIFENGEKVRLIHSIENSIPGLFASVTKPHTKYNPKYASECGIPSISREKVLFENIVTPYASFPVILANQQIGLVWYWTMLNANRMQGIYGSTESIHINGKKICPVLTWDSKITTILALCGGVLDYTRSYMKQHGVYTDFKQDIEREWSRVFTHTDEACHVSFQDLKPTHFIPTISRIEFDFMTINDCTNNNNQ